VKSFRFLVPTLAALTLAAMLTGCGKSSTPTGVTPIDETAPAAPAQVVGTPDLDNGGAVLQWTPSTSPNVSGYEVLQYSPDPGRDNAYLVVGQTDAQTTTYALPGITGRTAIYYRVRSITPSGKRSQWSAVVLVTVDTMGSPSESGDGTQLPQPKTP
jgi:hypothetical protein